MWKDLKFELQSSCLRVLVGIMEQEDGHRAPLGPVEGRRIPAAGSQMTFFTRTT